MRTPTKTAFILLCAATTILSTVIPADAASKTSAPKPSITGSAAGGDRGGFGGGPNSQAFAKYTACLAKAGVKLPAFGGGRRFGTPGVRPSGAPNFQQGSPRPRPSFSLSPKQQKAMAACASLRPSFGGFGNPGSNGSGGTTGSLPKSGASAAFIACLNTKGIPVQTPADVAGLDNQNTKIIAALKACAGK